MNGRLTENAAIILVFVTLTNMAAWIQFYIIDVDPIMLHYFFLPSAVGAIFGIILIYTRHYYQKSKKAEHFETAAKTDYLTGALNRYAFYTHINDEIERSVRKGRVFCMAMLDIDDFKKINDTYGHRRGDEVLVEFCRLVTSRLRAMDRFNRWGGEEFILLMPETTLDEALAITERIRKEVYEYDFGLDKPLTVSIGLTQNRENDNIESLVERIDEAMYNAKRLGKNRVETK